MWDRYNIVLNNDYFNKCDKQHRYGMFPTFEILNHYLRDNNLPALMPTNETSPLIQLFETVLEHGIGDEFFFRRFYELYNYRNCCLPISNRFPNLDSICDRLRHMWVTHDMTNYNKFLRLMALVNRDDEFDPLYDKIEKWTATKTETPDTTETTSGSVTTANTTDVTIDVSLSRTDTGTVDTTTENTGTETIENTGTETTAKTGTETNVLDGTLSNRGTENRTITNTQTKTGTDTTTNNLKETHGGTTTTESDNTRTVAENKTTGVTSFDQTALFINDDTLDTNGTISDDGETVVRHGQTITNTGTSTIEHNTATTDTGANNLTLNTTQITDNTDTTTYNTSDTKTLNTENEKTLNTETVVDTDTSLSTTGTTNTTNETVFDGSETSSLTKTKTGENLLEDVGKRLTNSGLSIAELQAREEQYKNLFDMYLNSVMSELSLFTVEEIW